MKSIKIKLIKIFFNFYFPEYDCETIDNELYVINNHILYDELIYTTRRSDES